MMKLYLIIIIIKKIFNKIVLQINPKWKICDKIKILNNFSKVNFII